MKHCNFFHHSMTFNIKVCCVDGAKKPFCPDGFEVESHQTEGQLNGLINMGFYLDKEQQRCELTGHEVHRCLEGKRVASANLLDYLLANKEIIPENWKEAGQIPFWGTIYFVKKYKVVRCLEWMKPFGEERYWDWHGYFLYEKEFNELYPALIIL